MSEETETPMQSLDGIVKIAAEFLALRAEKFRRQGELKAIEEQLDDANRRMNEALGPMEITSFDYQGKTLFQKVDPYPKIKPDKFDEFLEWLKDHGEDGIAKMTIHHKTLKKWYDTHPELEEELGDFLSAYSEININIRGDDQQEQRERAYNEFKAKWGIGL